MKPNEIQPGDPRPENQLKQRIAPGFWIDQKGQGHVSIKEMLDLVGLEDTPANRQAALEICTQVMSQHHPDAKMLFRATPDDPGTPIK